VSVSCTTEAWKCAASLSAPVLRAAAAKPSSSAATVSERPVAAPTVRAASCQSGPDGPVNTVGAICERAANEPGVSACDPRIRSGAAARTASMSGAVCDPADGRSWMTVPRYDG
jgi:hypothetical protein